MIVTDHVRALVLSVALALLALASPAWAQVQFETSAYITAGAGTSCAVPITIAANPNRALVVGVHTGAASVSSVTGAEATWASAAAVTRTSASNRVEIWVGTNPGPGAQTVTVTLSTTDGNIICGVESFFGVDQTTPTAHPTGSTGIGGTASLAVSSAANNLIFALASHNGFFGSPSGCTTSADWSTNPNTQTGQGSHCAGAATTTIQWSTSSTWSAAAVDIQAAAGGGGGGGGAALWAAILDPLRAVDWSRTNPGVEGGIPNRQTVCHTLVPGATAAQINEAIETCGTNQVVMLSAGTYNLSAGIDFGSARNVTLRGEGPGETIVNFSGVASCGAGICVVGSDDWVQGTGPTAGTATNWLAGFDKDTTQITLESVAGLSVGFIIMLDQDNDLTDTGNVFVCDSTTPPACSPEGNAPGRIVHPGIHRNQQQFVKVTAIAGNVVTITPGLYMPNWRSEQSPQAWWPDGIAEGIGIENMTLNHVGTCGDCLGIRFNNAHNSWVRNVKSLKPGRNHVWLYQSSHIQIQDSFFHGTKNAASQSYGVESYMSGDNLVINNIFEHVTSPLMTGPASGSVFAYNYMVFMDYTPSPAWMQASISGGHDAGNAMNLFEGNQGTQFAQDNYHGTSNFATVFRNHLTGKEDGKTSNTEVVNLFGFSRYANFVGNVLGTPGDHTNYTDDVSAPTGTPDSSIYLLGFAGAGETMSPATMKDPLVKATMLRWGNYDAATGMTRWVASEVPSGLSPFGNPLPANQILPPSFFLTDRPSWWTAGVPWPPIGPDVTGGTDLTGHAHPIPARVCYEDKGLASFDAETCYPGP